jgi:hypothetical protein
MAVLGTGHHLTVFKNFQETRNDFWGCALFRQPVIPPAPLTGDVGRDRGDAGRALLFCAKAMCCIRAQWLVLLQRKSGAPDSFRDELCRAQFAAALGARLRELRWKNSAWLATADTIAGWNGFEIRNAGSGRSPVRKRSG